MCHRRVTFRVIAVNWIGELILAYVTPALQANPSRAPPLRSAPSLPRPPAHPAGEAPEEDATRRFHYIFSSASQRVILSATSSPPPPFATNSNLQPSSALHAASSVQLAQDVQDIKS